MTPGHYGNDRFVVLVGSLKVLEVVRTNYDTLTLKLQDNLDHYEKYAEKSKETSFFTQLVRTPYSSPIKKA